MGQQLPELSRGEPDPSWMDDIDTVCSTPAAEARWAVEDRMRPAGTPIAYEPPSSKRRYACFVGSMGCVIALVVLLCILLTRGFGAGYSWKPTYKPPPADWLTQSLMVMPGVPSTSGIRGTVVIMPFEGISPDTINAVSSAISEVGPISDVNSVFSLTDGSSAAVAFAVKRVAPSKDWKAERSMERSHRVMLLKDFGENSRPMNELQSHLSRFPENVPVEPVPDLPSVRNAVAVGSDLSWVFFPIEPSFDYAVFEQLVKYVACFEKASTALLALVYSSVVVRGTLMMPVLFGNSYELLFTSPRPTSSSFELSSRYGSVSQEEVLMPNDCANLIHGFIDGRYVVDVEDIKTANRRIVDSGVESAVADVAGGLTSSPDSSTSGAAKVDPTSTNSIKMMNDAMNSIFGVTESDAMDRRDLKTYENGATVQTFLARGLSQLASSLDDGEFRRLFVIPPKALGSRKVSESGKLPASSRGADVSVVPGADVSGARSPELWFGRSYFTYGPVGSVGFTPLYAFDATCVYDALIGPGAGLIIGGSESQVGPGTSRPRPSGLCRFLHAKGLALSSGSGLLPETSGTLPEKSPSPLGAATPASFDFRGLILASQTRGILDRVFGFGRVYTRTEYTAGMRPGSQMYGGVEGIVRSFIGRKPSRHIWSIAAKTFKRLDLSQEQMAHMIGLPSWMETGRALLHQGYGGITVAEGENIRRHSNRSPESTITKVHMMTEVNLSAVVAILELMEGLKLGGSIVEYPLEVVERSFAQNWPIRSPPGAVPNSQFEAGQSLALFDPLDSSSFGVDVSVMQSRNDMPSVSLRWRCFYVVPTGSDFRGDANAWTVRSLEFQLDLYLQGRYFNLGLRGRHVGIEWGEVRKVSGVKLDSLSPSLQQEISALATHNRNQHVTIGALLASNIMTELAMQVRVNGVSELIVYIPKAEPAATLITSFERHQVPREVPHIHFMRLKDATSMLLEGHGLRYVFNALRLIETDAHIYCSFSYCEPNSKSLDEQLAISPNWSPFKLGMIIVDIFEALRTGSGVISSDKKAELRKSLDSVESYPICKIGYYSLINMAHAIRKHEQVRKYAESLNFELLDVDPSKPVSAAECSVLDLSRYFVPAPHSVTSDVIKLVDSPAVLEEPIKE